MKEPIKIQVSLPERSYPIYIGRGVLSRVKNYIPVSGKALIVTDEGVPAQYAEAVASQLDDATIVTVKEGEGSKCFAVLASLCQTMLSAGFTRGDRVIAVGGGIVGDLSGLAASLYMRGIDFYNIPTTLLSQVDSSIGGKVAVNLGGIKNAVGAFYQPRAVLIDPCVLRTLPERQISAGLAEALKMSMTSDASLFSIFERGEARERIEEVIVASLLIKKAVVEQDEKETGLRRVLNFGHTVGHGIESLCGTGDSGTREDGLYHGECVALGMLPMCKDTVRARLLPILKSLSLPTEIRLDASLVTQAMRHDKKAVSDLCRVIFVDEVGSFREEKVSFSALEERVRNTFGG